MNITRKLIRGTTKTPAELMESEGYLTNGQWAILANLVGCQFRPDNDKQPPISKLVEEEGKRASMAVERTGVKVHDVELLATPEGEAVCWIH